VTGSSVAPAGGRTPEWRDRLADWASSGLLPRFAVFAIPSAILVGILGGASRTSWQQGIASGILFGIVFGSAMTYIVTRRLRQLPPLSPDDLRLVTAAVRRGEPVGDPRLAPAVVQYAAIIRDAQSSARRVRILYDVFLAGSVIVLGVAIAARRSAEVTVDTFILGAVVIQRRLVPRRRERIIANADTAERLAREHLS
jgi:hypothetical protein